MLSPLFLKPYFFSKKYLAISIAYIIAICQCSSSQSTSNSSPLETTADEISIDSETNTYTLNGNAVAKQGDKTFMADVIVVYKNGEGELPKKVIGTGNVIYEEPGVVITSAKCESDMNFVIFRENVVVTGDDFGIIKADRADYNLKTKKMDVTADKKVKFTLDHKIENNLNKKSSK